MKFAEEHFPMGSYDGQKTPGAYINQTLAENIDIWAKKIVKDMHFLGIISGNDQVGNGKSTIASHIGCYLTHKINKFHGVNNQFTSHNMVFSAADLEKRSFELPKYSVIVLDESDDLKEHSAKEISRKLRTYFRKCRQLNQILILITPSFFELNKFYALNRSHALINVKFTGEYDRGRFDFYGPTKKKRLYLKGKKEWDYDAYKYDFWGTFASNYFFFPNSAEEVKRYKKKKYEDMINYEKGQEEELSKDQFKKKILKETFNKVLDNLDDMTLRQLSKGFGVSERTGQRWRHDNNSSDGDTEPKINNNTIISGDIFTEESGEAESLVPNEQGAAEIKSKELKHTNAIVRTI